MHHSVGFEVLKTHIMIVNKSTYGGGVARHRIRTTASDVNGLYRGAGDGW